MDLCQQKKSLLFNRLSRLVIAILPRSKHLLISWLKSPSAVILEPTKINSLTVSIVSSAICMKWWDQMPWSEFSECWALSQLFHSPLSPRGSLVLLHFCHKGGVICVSDVIDISSSNLDSTCDSFSLALCMMYFAYKLNKQGDNIQLWHTPFPIWNQSVVPYPVLTVASWHAYRFLKRQVRWSGIPISFRIFHSLL